MSGVFRTAIHYWYREKVLRCMRQRRKEASALLLDFPPKGTYKLWLLHLISFSLHHTPSTRPRKEAGLRTSRMRFFFVILPAKAPHYNRFHNCKFTPVHLHRETGLFCARRLQLSTSRRNKPFLSNCKKLPTCSTFLYATTAVFLFSVSQA